MLPRRVSSDEEGYGNEQTFSTEQPGRWLESGWPGRRRATKWRQSPAWPEWARERREPASKSEPKNRRPGRRKRTLEALVWLGGDRPLAARPIINYRSDQVAQAVEIRRLGKIGVYSEAV